MGNSESSSDSGSNACTGPNAPGLNEVCYNAGYNQTRANGDGPDIVGEAFQAGICTTNKDANACYGQGASDGTYGLKSNGCSGTFKSKL